MDRRHKPHQRRRLEAVDRTSHRKTYRHRLLVASPEHLPIAHTLPSDAREGWSELVGRDPRPVMREAYNMFKDGGDPEKMQSFQQRDAYRVFVKMPQRDTYN
ncbi:hypothetical protein L2E82_35564 [Cichorium intybus]|uniref:Uncharacterized protein n=1 Tax=Cichorium intybus TaxID=13427 RepID=A0ACB9BP57_CICIN|nr:hypothetical protein L2E82_35564 [Cichorium intybus]